MLGFRLGSADVLAQTSDRCYLEKCRDFLFREFALCGLAGDPRPDGPTPIYASAEQLLAKTVAFNRALWRERLDGYFGGAHRFLDSHRSEERRLGKGWVSPCISRCPAVH